MLVFKKKWKQQDELIIRFEAAVQKNKAGDDEYYFSYGPLVLCHPFTHQETTTRTFTAGGLVELSCTPAENLRYTCTGALPVEDEKGENRFLLEVNEQQKKIRLVPMAHSILRQVSFRQQATH